jgi:hypothetical protein
MLVRTVALSTSATTPLHQLKGLRAVCACSVRAFMYAYLILLDTCDRGRTSAVRVAYRSAAEVYLASGKDERAVTLLARDAQDWAQLLQVTRKLDRCGLSVQVNALFCSTCGEGQVGQESSSRCLETTESLEDIAWNAAAGRLFSL